jgi:hypothetical protein
MTLTVGFARSTSGHGDIACLGLVLVINSIRTWVFTRSFVLEDALEVFRWQRVALATIASRFTTGFANIDASFS